MSYPYHISTEKHADRWYICVPLLICLLFSGCATQQLVQMRSRPATPLAERLKLYSHSGPEPSERTLLMLRRHHLPQKISKQPQKLLSKVAAIHQRNPHSESCYALAELNFIAGQKLEMHHPQAATEYYLNCVARTYEYLFGPRYRKARNPYDPQFRGACDLYNGALENVLRIAQQAGHFKPGRSLSFETTVGQAVEINIKPLSKKWKTSDFDRFEFVSDFKVNGLKNQYKTFGLGVPLVAVRKRKSDNAEEEKYYAPNLSFPCTAFLRFPRVKGSVNQEVKSSLELHDPLEQTEMRVTDYTVPLQSDITTPLAYTLNLPARYYLDTAGLLFADKLEKVRGLYMVRPYESGKIPVLMVHGLWSSPMTWMEMFNDLQSNPKLRDHYQFWFYLYPTGKPFIESTADLRMDLAQLRKTVSKERIDPALNEMVLVGHSMGGLISRTLTTDSGDSYWNAVSKQPLVQVNASTETKNELQKIFYFKPDRHITRVVTIGSPHKGSKYANSFTRWLGRRVISLPGKTLKLTRQMVTLDSQIFRGNENPLQRTSLDSLSPESPILQVLYNAPKPKSIRYHNIVGITSDKPLHENTDGVVEYNSSHLEDVDSEKVIRAEHSHVHRHPYAINEVNRILLLHLDDIKRRHRSVIIPVKYQQKNKHKQSNNKLFNPIRRVEDQASPSQPVNNWVPEPLISSDMNRSEIIKSDSDRFENSEAGKVRLKPSF